MSDWAPLLLENQPKLSLSSTSRKTHPRQQKADLQSSHDRTQEASSTLEKMSRLNNSKTKRERKKHETAITEGIAPLDKVMKKGDRQWSGRRGEGWGLCQSLEGMFLVLWSSSPAPRPLSSVHAAIKVSVTDNYWATGVWKDPQQEKNGLRAKQLIKEPCNIS